MRTSNRTFLVGMALALLFSYGLATAQEPTPTAEPEQAATSSGPRFTASDVINVVNDLRIANGLAPLAVHPVLMQVAQAEANGISAGYGGHWRPDNLTLGQWLLSLGYPLSGDLSMDGYRAENWFVADAAATLEDITQFWQGDAEHRDTMFSAERSDIGAAVALGADGQLYVVLETALQTASGKMQYDAYAILTGIPQTQVAYSDMGTLAAKNGLLPQYSVPVKLSTPQPDGKLYHDVQYGQTLWSIAIAYHTTIKEIQALNNLHDFTIRDGQKLLVKKDVKQPIPTSELVQAPYSLEVYPTALPAVFETPVVEQAEGPSPASRRETMISIGAIAIAGLVLAGAFTAMMRKKGGSAKDV